MYSTLLDDQEYEPLLLIYLTTTGNTLGNHTRANLIAYALRSVVYRMGNIPEEFDTLGLATKSLETKRQLAADLRQQQKELAESTARLNTALSSENPGLPEPPTSIAPITRSGVTGAVP